MVIKNPNDIFVPDYLNEEFFATALEEGLREIQVTVKEVTFEWGSSPGDNYCSRIYRILVAYERLVTDDEPPVQEQRSLIIKSVLSSEGTQFLEDSGAFLKEKLTFLDVLPRLQILIDGPKFSATCFYTIKEPARLLVLTDLKSDGFSIVSRQKKLDWAHCELLLQQTGRLHATSMVLAKRDPEITKRFVNGLLCNETIIKSDTFKIMFGESLKQLANNAAEWPGFEKIAQKLQHFYDNFKPICAHLGDRRASDRIVVMNHGDLWLGNTMFAYDDPKQPDKPTRAIFMDFQFNFYSSPGCDLNFFLNTSVRLHLLQQRRDDLIYVYYKTFRETLEFLHYENIPTLDDLKYELRSRELYGLFALFGFLPLVTMPKELSDDSNIDNLVHEEFARLKYKKVFAEAALQAELKYGLKRLDDLGVLDEF
ncbi:uncharacterized protein LOC105212346 isoform X2 [Zeugodacus cucurbitae]|uniref:uncharacterized protein LOC105212346 isoform X2 n=1 Tax=Zeugodacus cucurbitae TaxID=28588 RepID=UPI0023D91EFF|nr:uncharacterized protein LOC105212346 isoform X2 [Zeugodacus cucurbitae]